MAGDWIKMRTDLLTHPKVVRILSATKTDKFRVIGGLHAVWSVFDAHSTDGQLHGYTPALMDTIIGWTGFAAAMMAVGWLEYDGAETLALPRFDDHNGKCAKRRGDDQKRKRDDRKQKEVPIVSANCPQEVRNESGLEKRREEKDISINQSLDHAGAHVVALRQPDAVERWPMFAQWYPSPEFESSLSFTPITPGTNWEAQLGEFCLYWADRQEERRTQAGWENKFLKNLLAIQRRQEANLA